MMKVKQAERMAITMGKSRYMWGFILFLMVGFIYTASCRRVGGIEDVPNFEQRKEIKDLGKYAVKEYNKQQNVALTFSKVVKAQQQVVAGTKYFLTLKVSDGAQSKLYRAVIYVRPWENFKELQAFTPVQE